MHICAGEALDAAMALVDTQNSLRDYARDLLQALPQSVTSKGPSYTLLWQPTSIFTMVVSR